MKLERDRKTEKHKKIESKARSRKKKCDDETRNQFCPVTCVTGDAGFKEFSTQNTVSHAR